MVRLKERSGTQAAIAEVATAIREERQAQAAAILEAGEREIMTLVAEQLPPKGTPISMHQAAVKYQMGDRTVRHWVQLKWVPIIDEGKGQGSRRLIDEHYVALIASQGIKQGGRTKPPENCT